VFRLIAEDPPAAQVRRITFVPFLPDGRCVLIEAPEGPALPAGEVLADEDYLLDTALRVPLQTAGFRYQRFRPFGQDGSHLYAWIEGAPYRGERPHTRARLTYCTAEQAASRLRDHGQPVAAAAMTAAAASYRAHDEQAYYADNLRTLERSYLRGQTPQSGSGFGADARPASRGGTPAGQGRDTCGPGAGCAGASGTGRHQGRAVLKALTHTPTRMMGGVRMEEKTPDEGG
jgi:hypothetical protein